MALHRFNLNLEEELLQQLDAYADKMHVNRSAAISFILSQKFQADEMLDKLPELLQVFHQISTFENSNISSSVLPTNSENFNMQEQSSDGKSNV